MMHLGCALPSSACSHYCSRVACLDGQCIPPLDSDCNGGVDCVGERMVGGEGEVVLGCEAELVDELLRVLTDASCGLHGEGNEVSELSGSDFLVLDLLGSGRLLSDCENCGATYRDMRWTERVRYNNIGQNASAWEDDLKVGSASIFSAEALRLFAGSST